MTGFRRRLSSAEKQIAADERRRRELDLYLGAEVQIRAVYDLTDDAGNPMCEVIVSNNR